jgi:ATP-dependent Clp protease ATP-binding subunit ClpC
LLAQLDAAKKAWEEETKTNRVVVTEDNVAEVVSMMSGVPVQRISQNEG